MATVIPIGEPVNEAKRQSLAYLRDHLLTSYCLFVSQTSIRCREDDTFSRFVTAPRAWVRAEGT